MKSLNIQPITWQKVYRTWKKNEDHDFWRAHYQPRGFSSWPEWRKNYIQPLGLEKLKWQTGELKNIKDILNFYGGPFKAWKKYFYKNKNSLTFKQLALLSKIKNNKRFKKLINNFPGQTTLIAIQRKNKIIIIDGMHRATALALMINKKQKIKTKINIAFAEYHKKTLPLLGQ